MKRRLLKILLGYILIIPPSLVVLIGLIDMAITLPPLAIAFGLLISFVVGCGLLCSISSNKDKVEKEIEEMDKEELVGHLVNEYEDFLSSCNFEYVKRVANSSKFDIRP
jgi:hypothetical protein